MKKFLLILLFLLINPVFAAAKINVAFTIDNNYPLFTMILMDSILENNKTNSDYKFWVVENNITKKNKAKMKDYVSSKGQEIEFIHFDTKTIDKGTNFFTFSSTITPIGMARIMLPVLLPSDVHKVLYLDSDMLATGDISVLYNTELGKYPAGMVENIVPAESGNKLHKFKRGYYNSGMILMNLDVCRKENSAEQMLDYLNKHKPQFVYVKNDIMNDYYQYPDQDLINIVWEGRIKPIHKKWNNQSIRGASIVNVLNYGIIHYIGSPKPWEFGGWSGYLYNELYYEHWRNSPFKSYMTKYFFLKFANDYKIMMKKKISRYEKFFAKLKSGSKESISELFYVYDVIYVK